MTSPYFGVPPYPPGPPPTPPTDTRRWITIGLLVTVLGFGVGVGFAFAGRSNDNADRVATVSDRSETTRTEPATTTTSLPPTPIPERLEFTLVHRMSPSICKVQVSSTDDAEWGPNRLEDDDRFETDDVRSFDAPYGDLLDLRATSCDGTETWSRRGVELDPDEQLVLNQDWSHTIVQTTTTGTTRPPATTSPPRTTPSTRTPATTSPPSTEPPCPYAATPSDVRVYTAETTDDGTDWVDYQLEFTSCSPRADYRMTLASSNGIRFGGASYRPNFGSNSITLGGNGSLNSKSSRFRTRRDFMRSDIRSLELCFYVDSSDGDERWGQYCASWTNPNPPSWDGKTYTVHLLNDGIPVTACFVYIWPAASSDRGDDRLRSEVMAPGDRWWFEVSGGPTHLEAQDCDHEVIWGRANQLIDSDRTYTFTGGLSYP